MERKKKKAFVAPRILQICEVMLERDLLGASKEIMRSSDVETTGHQLDERSTYEETTWTNGGNWSMD